jgi:hypothetical protein
MAKQVLSMKSTAMNKFAVLLATAALLTSCGVGGDDEAGGPTEFSIVPSSIDVTGPTGLCAVGTAGEVFIFGGVAPYKIKNTVPGFVSVNKTEVTHRGESFTVTFIAGCLDPGNIAVEDALGNVLTLTLTNKEGA